MVLCPELGVIAGYIHHDASKVPKQVRKKGFDSESLDHWVRIPSLYLRKYQLIAVDRQHTSSFISFVKTSTRVSDTRLECLTGISRAIVPEDSCSTYDSKGHSSIGFGPIWTTLGSSITDGIRPTSQGDCHGMIAATRYERAQ